MPKNVNGNMTVVAVDTEKQKALTARLQSRVSHSRRCLKLNLTNEMFIH